MAKNNTMKIDPVTFKKPIEYKMEESVAREYLKANKSFGKSTNINHEKAQEYLCKIVNDEYGILGNCVKVLTF